MYPFDIRDMQSLNDYISTTTEKDALTVYNSWVMTCHPKMHKAESFRSAMEIIIPTLKNNNLGLGMKQMY